MKYIKIILSITNSLHQSNKILLSHTNNNKWFYKTNSSQVKEEELTKKISLKAQQMSFWMCSLNKGIKEIQILPNRKREALQVAKVLVINLQPLQKAQNHHKIQQIEQNSWTHLIKALINLINLSPTNSPLALTERKRFLLTQGLNQAQIKALCNR